MKMEKEQKLMLQYVKSQANKLLSKGANSMSRKKKSKERNKKRQKQQEEIKQYLLYTNIFDFSNINRNTGIWISLYRE